MCFVHKQDILVNMKKDITHKQIFCLYHHRKAKPNRTWLTVGGEWINHVDDFGTSTTALFVVNLVLNSIIFYTKCEIYDNWHQNFLPQHLAQMIQVSMVQVDGYPTRCNRAVCIIWESNRWWLGICGDIKKNVWFTTGQVIGTRTIGTTTGTQKYRHSKHSPGLWTHNTWKIQFCHHECLWCQICQQWKCITPQISPQTVIQNHERLRGTKYVGLTIDWQYKTKQVYISMPGYISKALKCFNYKAWKKMQYQPHLHIPPQYDKQI